MSDQPELTAIAGLVAGKLGYRSVSFCGKGSFKETFRVEDTRGNPLALKLVDRTKISVERTDREIEALKRCDSPRIAKVFDTRTFTAPDTRIFDVVVEEFFDGGSLEEWLNNRRASQQEVIDLVVGLLLAVRDLRPHRLVHRDIKPANIMFRKGKPDPVLVDFGIVRDLSQTSLTATWLPQGPGTPFFASPEQLNNEKALIDWRSDQFAIGVIASLLLSDRHPYQTDPANPNTAVHAVSERRGPAPEFQQRMKELGLPSIIRMVQPWPVQRFAEPNHALALLKK